ncbi:uncharacterized protein [Apostichopus japonicus]|uniref:uncharacterized protein isoform X2 n=1 Tax=Stichopus japonicus TaxID=307972 RepID=UPI003AB70DA0
MVQLCNDSVFSSSQDRYFTWSSGVGDSFSNNSIWNTQYGMARDCRTIQTDQDHSNDWSQGKFESIQPVASDVVLTQPPRDSEPAADYASGDSSEPPTGFQFEQFTTTEEEVEDARKLIPTYIKVIVILALVVCKPFGEKALEHLLMMLIYRNRDEEAESNYHLRQSQKYTIYSYLGFVFYMAIFGVVLFLSIKYK